MITENIPIQLGQWLTDALLAKNPNYKNIPSNVIINKLLPGLGATHMEIKSHRHSIIIEPNVPVILGKAEKDKNILPVWKPCTHNKIRKYLADKKIKYKKIITTPEGYSKLREVITDGHTYIYNDYFLLFDECEKITQDHDFRENISIPINDFFNKFQNKAFVSATPLIPSDPRFEEQDFRILKIKPQYNYKKDINLIVTNNCEKELLNYIQQYRDSDCICIFLNKTDSINSIINTLGIADQSKVFCSKESADKLKKLEFDTYEHLDLPLAKYNFFTSRFYSAVDIKLTAKQTPDILILTDRHSYTRVDPNTQVIQIYGRFRNGFKSLTHIAQYNDKIKVSEDYELEQELEMKKEMYQEIEALKSKYMFSFTDILDNAIRGQLEKLDYTKYLDENNQLNYFAVDNMFYDNEVNGYYKSPEALKEAYDNTKHFNINYTPVTDPDLLIIFDLKELSVKKQRIGIVNQLEILEIGFTNGTISEQEKSDLIRLLKQVDNFIVDVYYELGKAVIDKHKFSQSKLTKALTDKRKEFYRLSPEVAQEIYNNFESREGTYIDKDTILKEVVTIYNRLGIDYNVKKKTIEDYYHKPSVSNSKNKPSYKLEVRKIQI